MKSKLFQHKAVILIIVMGTLIVFFMLAAVSLHLMTQQANVSENSIRRTKSYYTAQAAIVHAFERLRKEGIAQINAAVNPINCETLVLNGFTATVYVAAKNSSTTCPGSTITLNCPANAPSDYCVKAKVDY